MPKSPGRPVTTDQRRRREAGELKCVSGWVPAELYGRVVVAAAERARRTGEYKRPMSAWLMEVIERHLEATE